MANFDVKSFITQARQKGVSDDETMKYLVDKNIIDRQGNLIGGGASSGPVLSSYNKLNIVAPGATTFGKGVQGYTAVKYNSKTLKNLASIHQKQTDKIFDKWKKETDPNKKEQWKRLLKSSADTYKQSVDSILGLNEQVLSEMPTTKQVIGAAGQAAAQVLSAGTYGKGFLGAGQGIMSGTGKLATGNKLIGNLATKVGLKTTEKITPIATKGLLGATKRIGLSAAQGGVSSAIMGTGKGLEEGKTFKEALQQGKNAGITSAVISGTASAAAEILKAVVPAGKTYASALGAKTDKEKKATDLLLKEGIVGSSSKIRNISQSKINAVNKEIETVLANTKTNLNTDGVANEIFENLKATKGNQYSDEQIWKIINKLPVNLLREERAIPLPQANALRMNLDKDVQQIWKALNKGTQPTITLKNEAIMEAASVLRNRIKNVSGTEELFAKEASYINAYKLADKALRAGKDKMKFNVLDAAIGGSGLFGGPAAGAGTMAGVLAIKAAKTPLAKTATAVASSKAPKASEYITPELKVLINRLVAEYYNQK